MRIIISLVAIALLACSSFKVEGSHQNPNTVSDDPVATVTYCELIKHPKRFHNKVVRVTAIFERQFERSSLSDEAGCDSGKVGAGQSDTWVSHDKSFVIDGDSEQAKLNESVSGFGKWWLVAVGRFRRAEGSQRFGHLRCCKYDFALMRIEKSEKVADTFSQAQSRVIEWQAKPMGSNNERWGDGTQPFRILDRVEIESVKVGESITIGQPFSATDDWLQNLVIRVRNISGQHVAAIQVTLVLPQMGPGSPDVVYCYGCAAAEKAQGIATGEAVDLKMPGGGFYDFVKSRAAASGGISQINKAQIRDMYVTLADGARWVSGCVKTANSKSACPLTAP